MEQSLNIHSGHDWVGICQGSSPYVGKVASGCQNHRIYSSGDHMVVSLYNISCPPSWSLLMTDNGNGTRLPFSREDHSVIFCVEDTLGTHV